MAKRRRFLALLSATACSTALLAGCLGNPPSSTGNSTPTPVARNANLETQTISLGFIPVLEAAPLVIGVDCQATSKTEPLPTPKTEPPPTRSGALFP